MTWDQNMTHLNNKQAEIQTYNNNMLARGTSKRYKTLGNKKCVHTTYTNKYNRQIK